MEPGPKASVRQGAPAVTERVTGHPSPSPSVRGGDREAGKPARDGLVETAPGDARWDVFRGCPTGLADDR